MKFQNIVDSMFDLETRSFKVIRNNVADYITGRKIEWPTTWCENKGSISNRYILTFYVLLQAKDREILSLEFENFYQGQTILTPFQRNSVHDGRHCVHTSAIKCKIIPWKQMA